MADFHQRLPGNVPGEFFVDARCTNCDACGGAPDPSLLAHAAHLISS